MLNLYLIESLDVEVVTIILIIMIVSPTLTVNIIILFYEISYHVVCPIGLPSPHFSGRIFCFVLMWQVCCPIVSCIKIGTLPDLFGLPLWAIILIFNISVLIASNRFYSVLFLLQNYATKNGWKNLYIDNF